MDDTNTLTMNHHKYATHYMARQKKQDGKFSNSYAADTSQLGFGQGGLADPARMTQGLARVSPDKLTTQRQIDHYNDHLRSLENQRRQKAELR